MMYRIACLMVVGGIITTEISNQLYKIGRDLVVEKRTSKSFRINGAEGLVTTDHKYGLMGNLHGYICEAEIETESQPHKIKAKYIVSPPYIKDDELDERQWQSSELRSSYAEVSRSFDKAMNAHNN